MLIHDIALIPDVFDGTVVGTDVDLSNDVWSVLDELTRASQPANVLVANLYKELWEKRVQERLDCREWSETPRARQLRSDLIAFLKELDSLNRLVRYPRSVESPPANDQAWLDLAQQVDSLDWIVPSRLAPDSRTTQDPRVLPLSELRKSESWRSRETSAQVRMCESGYEAALCSVLRHAKKLKLIDPYLAPDDRHSKIVDVAVRLMRPPGDRCLIEIHTKSPKDESLEFCFENWERRLLQIRQNNNAKHKFRVCFWSNFERRFHNRHLLTDQWGIHLGIGFDSYSEPTSELDNWDLISNKSREQVWYEYHVEATGEAASTSPFRLAGCRSI